MKRSSKIILFILGIIAVMIMIQYLVLHLPLEDRWREMVIPSNKFEKGAIKKYYEDSTLKSAEVYQKGVLHGKSIFYYPNGRVESIIFYKKGLKEGTAYYFSENEELVYTSTFSSDKLVKEKIVNDSLYRYDLKVLAHGQSVFRENCEQCHNHRSENLSNDLLTLRDTLRTNLISIDSLHYKLLDPSQYGGQIQDSLLYFRDSINLKDVNALIRYVNEKKNKRAFPTVKQLRVWSKKI